MDIIQETEYFETKMRQLGWEKVTRCKDCQYYSPFTETTVSWCPITRLKGLPADSVQ